jgi:AAA ATPase domain
VNEFYLEKGEMFKMAQFEKVQITEVVAEGFKGFKERTVLTLEEGKNTFIGENGHGKSSIGELIVWVLTGKNIQGKSKDLNIINKDCEMATGSINFIDENGENHEVERKLSSTTTLKFDQKRITQKHLEELISTEIFLLIFNPLYFLSLDMESSRNAIYSLIPGVEKEDVLAELNPQEKAFLEAEHFDIQGTNEYLKNRRKDLKEIDDAKKHVQGYMARLNEKIDIPASMTFDNKQIENVEKQLSHLNEKKPVLKNLSDVLMKKAELDKSLVYVKEKRFESETIKMELLNQKTLLEQQIKAEQVKEYKPLNTSKLETDIALLRNDYKSIATQHKTLTVEGQALDKKQIHFHEGDECPSCKQVITAKAVQVLNGELQKQVNEAKATIHQKQEGFEKTLAQLEQEGKSLLAEITKAKNEDELNRKKFEEEKKAMITKLQSELDKVLFKLNNLKKEEDTFVQEQKAKMNLLTKQIEALQLDKLEKENAQIQISFDEEVKKERMSLQTTLTSLRKEKDTVLQNETRRNALIKRAEDNAKELEKKKVELASYEKKEAHINNQISYMKIFNAQKISLMNRALSKHLNNISLKLEKTIQSTGEIKDCFEVLYMDKELKICSTSETIKAGLEISHMIRELSGLDYPVFVDNGESITSYEENAFQTIETKVVKDKKLSLLKNGKEVEIVAIPKAKVIIKSKKMDDEMVEEMVN